LKVCNRDIDSDNKMYVKTVPIGMITECCVVCLAGLLIKHDTRRPTKNVQRYLQYKDTLKIWRDK